MWTLEQVRAEYHRLDRLLGIDTSGIPVRLPASTDTVGAET